MALSQIVPQVVPTPVPAGDHYPRRETGDPTSDTRLSNWARNAVLATSGSIRTPADENELRTLLAAGEGRVRVIGSRMSPGRMLALSGTEDTLLDLSMLTGLLAVDDDTATFAGATPLAEVYSILSERGLMLPSSPGVIAHQTLAGALSTGTHGQGLQQSSIADVAVRIRLVLADGSVAEFGPEHPWFGAVQLGLGLLGVITAVTLRTEASAVYTCLKNAVPADTLADDLEVWNRDYPLTKAWWFPDENQVHVWTARAAGAEEEQRYLENGRQLVEGVATNDVLNETIEQTLQHMRDDTKIVDENGKPFRTVTRFKDFSDVTGDVYQVFCRGIATPQINVEIGIPLAVAGGMIKRIKEWHAETQPRLHYPIILRCTGASESWLSPAHGQETCFFGFVVYYAEDGSLSEEGVSFLRAVEQVLAAEGGRPHWGKYFDESLYDWPALYPQWSAFAEVREALDPRHRFDNAFTEGLFSSEVSSEVVAPAGVGR